MYGLGGESVFVGIDILVTKWFQGNEIGFAYGLIQAAGQAGSFTALYSVPPLVEAFHGDVNNVYLISLCASLAALTALGIARVLEKTAYGRKPPKKPEPSAAAVHEAVLQLSVGGHFGESSPNASARGGAMSASLLANDEGGGAVGGEAPSHHAASSDPDEEEDEKEEIDTDIMTAELNGRLSQNLQWAACIPPLYHTLMFLGIGHMFSLKWRFYCVLGGIVCYSSAFYT